MRFSAGYLTDPALQAKLNGLGRNYWWTYISEVIDRLGLSAGVVDVGELPERLPALSVLFAGGTNRPLPMGALDEWVRSGGVLIGSACEGLDKLFGVEPDSTVEQPGGEFSIGGEIRLKDSEFTQDIHSPIHPDAPLLAASDIRLLRAGECDVIAECQGKPVITARKHGKGWAFYFGFDLGQTFWVIQQGRPADRDWDGDGMLRTVDMVVTGGCAQDIPYTDELLFILQNMLGVLPIPLLHQLPHDNGRIPDFAIYFSGDDEGASDVQIPAAEFMADRGLPYHINCMASGGRFGLDHSQIGRLNELGTELSLHYNYIDGFDHLGGFEQSDTRAQTEAFVEHFGFLPVCPVSHVVRWTGWAEPAIWMHEAGVKGDNSYAHVLADVLNPMNMVGFAFGTSYPFHIWLDSSRSNSRLDFVEIPFTGYEIGYEDDVTDFEMVDKCLTLAEHYNSTLSFFYHPVYIAKYPACREAIDYLKARLEEYGPNALLTTSDTLITWWHERSAARIEGIKLEDGRLSFSVSAPVERGVVVKVPLGSYSVVETDAPHRIVEKFGRKWLLLAAPRGETEFKVRLA